MSAQKPITFFVPSHSSYKELYTQIYHPYSLAARRLQLKQVGGHYVPNPGEQAQIQINGLSDLKVPGDEFIRLDYADSLGNPRSCALEKRGQKTINQYVEEAVNQYRELTATTPSKAMSEAISCLSLDEALSPKRHQPVDNQVADGELLNLVG